MTTPVQQPPRPARSCGTCVHWREQHMGCGLCVYDPAWLLESGDSRWPETAHNADCGKWSPPPTWRPRCADCGSARVGYGEAVAAATPGQAAAPGRVFGDVTAAYIAGARAFQHSPLATAEDIARSANGYVARMRARADAPVKP